MNVTGSCINDCKGFFSWNNQDGVCINDICQCADGWSGDDDWGKYNNCQVSTGIKHSFNIFVIVIGALHITLALWECRRLVFPLIFKKNRLLLHQSTPHHTRKYFGLFIPTTALAISHLLSPLGLFMQATNGTGSSFFYQPYVESQSASFNIWMRFNYVLTLASFCNGLWLQVHVYYQFLPPFFTSSLAKIDLIGINYYIGFFHGFGFSLQMIVDYIVNTTRCRYITNSLGLSVLCFSIFACSILGVYILIQVRNVYMSSRYVDETTKKAINKVIWVTHLCLACQVFFGIFGCIFVIGVIVIQAMRESTYIFMSICYGFGSLFQIINMLILRKAKLPGLTSNNTIKNEKDIGKDNKDKGSKGIESFTEKDDGNNNNNNNNKYEDLASDFNNSDDSLKDYSMLDESEDNVEKDKRRVTRLFGLKTIEEIEEERTASYASLSSAHM